MKRHRWVFWLFTAMLPLSSLHALAAGLTTEQEAVHVLNRLGYGPRPGDIERVRQMGVDRYIEQQLNPSSIPLPAALAQRLDDLPAAKQPAGATLASFLAVRQAANSDNAEAQQKRRDTVRQILEQTATARVVRAVESPRQLEEVMVDFWFNHFNVFAGKGLDAALIASYERDAIRPYALGSFRDLLGATAKHPAMLFYLDNWLSTSADYRPGWLAEKFGQGPKAKSAGLNENYARELMELHTLGVDGGYSQKDVTELARMLTGWSFRPRDLARSNAGFHFDAERHDQGSKEWLGRRISAQGIAEGELALDILAMHPATAHHLSYQLAQYFVQDRPPEALVDRMARCYLETKGDIRAVLHTLFFSPEFRSPAAVGAKFKTPYRFVISAARAADLPTAYSRPLLGMLIRLGMPLYGCQTPDGYKNTEQAWLNPDALTRRIDFASALGSGRLPLLAGAGAGAGAGAMSHADGIAGMDQARMDRQPGNMPMNLPPVDGARLLQTMGPAISARTRSIVAANPPALQAAMLLGSPDFMRH